MLNETKGERNRMKTTIQYYTREVYGNRLEYVRDVRDAKIIQQLTGKKTITGVERELLRDLSNGAIQFERCHQLDEDGMADDKFTQL